jgi:hypothetical protein
MFIILFRGERIAAFSNASIAAAVAITRFATGQLIRGEVTIERAGI